MSAVCNLTATLTASKPITADELRSRGVRFRTGADAEARGEAGQYEDRGSATPDETEEVRLKCDRDHDDSEHHHDPERGDWSTGGVKLGGGKVSARRARKG